MRSWTGPVYNGGLNGASATVLNRHRIAIRDCMEAWGNIGATAWDSHRF